MSIFQMRTAARGTCLSLVAAGSLIWLNEALAQQPSPAIIRNLSDNKFATLPVLPGCWTVAVQSGDPSKVASVMLVKGTAGCAVTWHWHTPNEHVMMVSGKAIAQMKDERPVELGPGGFALLPAHHVHRFRYATSCTSFVCSDGAFDIHWVDESGKEITTEDALKAVSKGTKQAKQR